MDIRPVRNESDLAAALAEIERLMGAELGTPEGDRLDLLVTLVEAYEAAHHPMELPEPLAAIQFRMEQLGLDPPALQELVGNVADVRAILSRRQPLSLEAIRAFNRALGVPADILIQEYPLERRSA